MQVDAPSASFLRLSESGTEQGEERKPVRGVILVVDDDDPVRVMLSRLLRTQGYTVLQASHAHEARTILASQLPDLVISDIVMPGESGIELRRHIARKWPDLPVFLISGYSAEGPAEFAARTPHTTFVQKPFAADQLLALIEKTLSETGGDRG
ncbi:MAG: response regulator [Dehalococcoidia bacterium]|nr:response regulator [Dehalococcoidia bacterium]